MTPNEKAFLDMLAWSEIGDAMLKNSDNGYNVLVGSLPGNIKTFPSYADHPRILVHIRPGLDSTAAGRYQIKRSIYDTLHKRGVMRDFSPKEQDRGALYLISEKYALAAINSGYIETAIRMVRGIWASLPGAGYNQHEHNLGNLIDRYLQAGGTVA